MTALPKTNRYIMPGVSKVYYLPAVNDPVAGPTRQEITAGTDLSAEIADIAGFSTTTNMVDTPDLGSRFTSQIPGRVSAETSSLTIYADRGGDDVSAVLPRDTEGYIYFMDGGDVPGDKADLFEVTVSSNSKTRSADGAVVRVVTFAITTEPREGLVIPAAA